MPSQWETKLHCNVVSHWRDTYTNWSQWPYGVTRPEWVSSVLQLLLYHIVYVFTVPRWVVWIKYLLQVLCSLMSSQLLINITYVMSNESSRVQGPWWWLDMETLSALLALCEGNPPFTGGFPSQRASNVELWFSFLHTWTDCWTNSGVAGDLTCCGPHVMSLNASCLPFRCQSHYTIPSTVPADGLAANVARLSAGTVLAVHESKKVEYFWTF